MPSTARIRSFPGSALLRRGAPAGALRRPVCQDCHRTPLVGERIHFYAGPASEQFVCDLCRPRRAAAPERTELMHAPDSARAVRVLGAPV